jgi:hypothetical protein
MFKRRFRGINPWTVEQYAGLSKDSLKSILPALETGTLKTMENTLESDGSLTQAQKDLDRAIFWELYKREHAARKQHVTSNDDDVQAVDHDHRRSVHAKQLGIKKHTLVLEKRCLKREAIIAQNRGHSSGCKPKKPLNASSHKVDVVEPTDVWCDLQAERDVDWQQDCLLARLLAENAADPWNPMNPILGHLRI